MFNSLKVRTKMLLLGSIFMCSIIVVGAIGIINAQTLNNGLRNSFEKELQPMNYIQTVSTYIAMVNSDLAHISSGLKNLDTADNIITNLNNLEVETEKIEELRETQRELINGFTENTTALEQNVTYLVSKAVVLLDKFESVERTAATESLYAEFTTMLGVAREQRNLLFEQLNNRNFDTAETTVEEAISAQNGVQESIKRLTEQLRREAEDRNIQANESFRSSIQAIFMIIIVIGVIGSVVMILIINSITKPINLLVSKLSQVAKGDLTIEVPTNFKAEFGEMFESFKKMLGNLKNLMTNAQTTSSDIHVVFGNVQNTINDLHENIKVIDKHIYAVTTGVESQMASLKESSAAIDNIANGVSQIADSSTSVSELATETSIQANDGSAVIEKSVVQMEIINQVVEDTSGVVDRLVKRTQTIDEALKAITAIAEQTNLLSLNASIEAARAGEQGRGFAVVAEEVSKLADQSKASANEINTLLLEINEDTKEAVQAMEKGKLESKQGIEIIQQAGQAFKNIVEQVTEMTEQVQEVSSTVEELASGTEEVNASLADVVQTSEEIPKHANKMVEHSEIEDEILDRLFTAINATQGSADNLDGELNKFKVETDEAKK